MGRYWTIDAWENANPYEDDQPKYVRKGEDWDDELLDKEFDLRDEEMDDVDE